ncbi:hypothetical protein ACFFTN_01325 [Aminobacter aganoensis]|uniref:Uncharacterized protein n=1 Tax=Aminobacter aganoensis TaxID=83264 RepID=A0A7X0F5S7_9HYPH|nr:hypothetical protein [Aminobacter aganoensis]MBB6353500.1 hypothetical protein [Aminobacter aganoensis]
MTDMVEKVARAMFPMVPNCRNRAFEDHPMRYDLMDKARAAIDACASEIDALVERRKADNRNQGNDHILATAAFLRHAALSNTRETK